MNKNKPGANYTELWMFISILLLAYIFYQEYVRPKSFISNVRAGKFDTVIANDSVYLLKIKIDSQYYEPEEREPYERP